MSIVETRPSLTENHRWPSKDIGIVSLEPRTPVAVGTLGTWVFRYVAGPYGVDDGGALKFLLPIPSDRGVPQFTDSRAAEYVTVSNSGSATVSPRWVTKAHNRPWVKGIQVDVSNGALAPGDIVELVWGDPVGGGPGASMQSYVEEASPVRVMVDAFATNVYVDVPGEVTLDVVPGPAATLVATAKSSPRDQSSLRVAIRAVDRYGNVATGYVGSVEVSLDGGTVAVIDFAAGDAGVRSVTASAPAGDSVVRFDVTDAANGFAARTNPSRRDESDTHVYWGDTQGQTGETVGAGTLTQFFEYARDAAGLDFVTHSANDFQVTNDAYAESLRMVDEYTTDGRFVSFGGFEWSGNTPVGGDHNVLYADTARAPLLRSSHALLDDHSDLDTDRRTITEVYDTFTSENIDALTVCHVGGRRALPSMIDTRFTPVLEVTSVHGWFEWFALDVIRAGKDIGLVAASDDHSGRPGGSYPSLPVFGVRSGLAAVRATDLSRRAIMDGMRSRNTYATTGERILLDVTAGERRMGDIWSDTHAPTVTVTASTTAPIETIDVLDADGVLASWRPVLPLSDRRLRVSWRGALSRDRGRVQNWTGRLAVTGASITSADTWAFDHPDQGITGRDSQSVSWVSSTNGDLDGIILDLDSRPGTLAFTAGGVELNVDLSELGDTPLEFAVEAGVDRAVTVEWLPVDDAPLDTAVSFDQLPFHPGRNVYLVRVTQADGHRAWASPLYVYSAS